MNKLITLRFWVENNINNSMKYHTWWIQL